MVMGIGWPLNQSIRGEAAEHPGPVIRNKPARRGNRGTAMVSPVRSFNKPQPGSPAPAFALPLYPSGTLAIDQLWGQRNVLLYFYGLLFCFDRPICRGDE